MPIEVEIKENDSPTFPCLMKNKKCGAIVYMWEKGKGVVIKCPEHNGIKFDDNWDMNNLEPFRGHVSIVQN